MTTRDAALTQARSAVTGGLRLGERLRQLRVAAGLTQSELAGERFSKEYVSQIERGKTRPTRETVDWLAARLGVDPGFLANGVATDERGRLEGALARAETLIEALRNEDAAAEYESLVPAARATGVPELAVRALVGRDAVREEACVDTESRSEPLDRLARRAGLAALDLAHVLLREAIPGQLALRHAGGDAQLAQPLAQAKGGRFRCGRKRVVGHWRRSSIPKSSVHFTIPQARFGDYPPEGSWPGGKPW